eukprot:g7684.t1
MAFLPIAARNLFFAPTRAIRKRPRPKILARKFSGIPFQIPTGHELTDSEAQMLYDFTKDGGILALTGAGLSTESGIPDYRSPDGSYSKGHKPILHSEFVNDTYKRKRYWARSIIGYAWFDAAEPNIGHHALRDLERKNIVSTIVTQNVDSLHYKAGSKSALELHGCNRDVVCLNCGYVEPRPNYQDRINELNLEWIKSNLHHPLDADNAGNSNVIEDSSMQKIDRFDGGSDSHHVTQKIQIRADGDAHLGDVSFDDFQIPGCERCIHGIMKPNVVFFGGNMESSIRQGSTKKVEEANKLLICGTSVFVFSAYRLCLKAKELGKEIGILNVGETRADKLSKFKFETQCGSALRRLADKF